ncbi:MAG TPA: response regulator [Phycisphaerae bacterium]|nr:response regulator [Phycisphaerae bacterium]
MPKALVVDDESDAREFVRAILEPDGWEVIEAEDGVIGVQKAKDTRPDLAILDVEMPNMNGFQVFTELIKLPETADTKIIMLTGVADKLGMRFSADDMGNFLGREPDAYVEKPIDPDQFKRVVRDVTTGD